MKYFSDIDLLEVNNQFHNLKKGKMSISEYVAAFIEKIKLVPNLVPNKLSKLNEFVIELPTDFSPTMKLETSLKATIWGAMNVETWIRKKGMESLNWREKGSLEDLQGLIRRVDFRILTPTTRELGLTNR